MGIIAASMPALKPLMTVAYNAIKKRTPARHAATRAIIEHLKPSTDSRSKGKRSSKAADPVFSADDYADWRTTVEQHRPSPIKFTEDGYFDGYCSHSAPTFDLTTVCSRSGSIGLNTITLEDAPGLLPQSPGGPGKGCIIRTTKVITSSEYAPMPLTPGSWLPPTIYSADGRSARGSDAGLLSQTLSRSDNYNQLPDLVKHDAG